MKQYLLLLFFYLLSVNWAFAQKDAIEGKSPYDEDSIEVAPVDASRPDYYGEYSLSEVYGGKKRQRFDFKYKYRFKGDTQWETVNLRSLRNVTLDLIDE